MGKVRRPPTRRRAFWLAGLTLAVVAIIAGAVAAGELGPDNLWLDLLAHFRRQYVWALVGAVIVLLVDRRPRLALLVGAGAIGLATMAYQLLPLPPEDAERPVFRVLHANLLANNPRIEEIEQLVGEVEPDLVFFCESGQPNGRLDKVLAKFPHRAPADRASEAGQMILSRYPIVAFRTVGEIPETRPALLAEIDTPAGIVTLVGTHLRTPLTETTFALRNQQLAELAATLAAIQGPVLVVGDFNVTPWSGFFSDFTTETGLQRACPWGSVLPTWPAHLPLIRLPIDHVLGNEQVRVIAVKRGRFVGSDHFPLIADFQLKPKRTGR